MAGVSKAGQLPYISATMNIFDKSFSPSEAQLRYLDADYVVLRPGTFVRCAITGSPIPLDELTYWNVDRQEPYANAEAAYTAYQRYGLTSRRA
jgi:hypothetical protein